MAFIHPTADVKTSDVGDHTNIWQFCVVLPGAKIGENCNICANCVIDGDVRLGNNVTVKSGVYLVDGLVLEDNVFIGTNVAFTNDPTPRSKVYPDKFQRTVLGRGASIGANSTILGGTVVGTHALVGAASLVTKDVPAHGLVYGNPATLKGWVCECGTILKQARNCPSCGLQNTVPENGNTSANSES